MDQSFGLFMTAIRLSHLCQGSSGWVASDSCSWVKIQVEWGGVSVDAFLVPLVRFNSEPYDYSCISGNWSSEGAAASQMAASGLCCYLHSPVLAILSASHLLRGSPAQPQMSGESISSGPSAQRDFVLIWEISAGTRPARQPRCCLRILCFSQKCQQDVEDSISPIIAFHHLPTTILASDSKAAPDLTATIWFGPGGITLTPEASREHVQWYKPRSSRGLPYAPQ